MEPLLENTHLLQRGKILIYKSANVHHVVIGRLKVGLVVLTRNGIANEHVVHHVNGNDNWITMVALESMAAVSNGG